MEVLLAKRWNPEISPTGWLVSEKLDGIRAIHKDGKLVSRNGNPVYAPDWFMNGLPDATLDGELWMGRGMFQDCLKVVRRNVPDERWNQVQFMVFDMPDLNTGFENRYEALKESVSDSTSCTLVEHSMCHGFDDLYRQLTIVKHGHGEGLMLRKSGSLYEGKRSSTLLKVKTHCDDEAQIVGYTDGKGKYSGQVGALICKLENGKTFNVGSGMSDSERITPPEIGKLITVRYHELTRIGVPREPRFVCIVD